MDTQTPGSASERALGPMIGLVIILAIILIGGVYFYATIQKSTEYQSPNTTGDSSSLTTPAGEQGSNGSASTSTNTDSIEADLNAYGGAAIDNINPNF